MAVVLNKLIIRRFTMDDAEDLLRWKNDPETRKNSIVTHDEIQWEDHVKWLTSKLTDPFTDLYIITDESRTKYGDLRFDHRFDKGNDVSEVSIRIDAPYRKKGIATEILKRFVHFTTYRYVAKIVDGNIASIRAFINAGFKPFSHEDGFYWLEKYAKP